MPKEHSELVSRLLDKEFIISAQIDPPGIPDRNELQEEIAALQRSGISVVDVNASRRISYDSLHLSSHIANFFDLVVIPHIALRNGPIESLMNQILTTYALSKVRDFLVVSGDPYETTSKFSLPGKPNTARAIQAFDNHLRQSNLALNIEFAAAVNQNEDDLYKEGQHLEAKVAANTDFFLSQPVFTPTQAEYASRFYRQHASKPLIMGIWPLASQRTVTNIRDGKVIGVTIPDEIYESANGHTSSETLLTWSSNQSYELIRYIQAYNLANGVYLVAPLRKPSQLVNLAERISSKVGH